MIEKIFPFVAWLRTYTRAQFHSDFIAGITVPLVLIPQCMAYAQLANLPAWYGLYAAFLPPCIAALFGSSRHLITGPVAMVSLMTAAALEPLATAGTESYIAYAIILGFVVGLFQFLLGAFRLGIVINFISHPIVNGFINAGALIIASSQLAHLLGANVEKAPHHYETIYRVVVAAGSFIHWPTLLLALLALGIMIGLKFVPSRIPAVLVAVCVTTVISWATGFDQQVQTDISSIKASGVVEDIRDLNQTLATIDKMNDQQREMERYINDAKRERLPETEVMRLVHQQALMILSINNVKRRASEIRINLRKSYLNAGTSTNGSREFYLRDNIPPNMDVGDAVWRIIIGNQSINEHRIQLMAGGKVVGDIPRGLPAFSMPKLNWKVVLELLPMVVIIALIGFMEAIAVAKTIASHTRQRLDPNQELIGQGLANMVGSIGNGYPVSGSFSKSALNYHSGAATGMSGVITSVMVLIAMLFLTPLLYHLPQSVLAAVIMMAVLSLINVQGFLKTWQSRRFDGIVATATFLGTLTFAPHLEYGILIGVSLSLLNLLHGHLRPEIALLSKLPDGSFRNAVRWNLKMCRYIGVVRVHGSLFFASAHYLEESIYDEVESLPHIRHVLLESNGMNELDATGIQTVDNLVHWLRDRNIQVSFVGLSDSIMDTFKRTHLAELIGADHFYHNIQLAIDAVHADAHAEGEEEICPLVTTCYID